MLSFVRIPKGESVEVSKLLSSYLKGESADEQKLEFCKAALEWEDFDSILKPVLIEFLSEQAEHMLSKKEKNRGPLIEFVVHWIYHIDLPLKAPFSSENKQPMIIKINSEKQRTQLKNFLFDELRECNWSASENMERFWMVVVSLTAIM